MDRPEIESRVKIMFLCMFVGMLFGALITLSSVGVLLGNDVEVVLLAALGINLLCGVIAVFVVYLIYFLKTYTVITRERLKVLLDGLDKERNKK